MENKLKYNILLIASFTLILQSCDSQNSKYIGDGLYDLDNIDFTMPLDSIAHKVLYNTIIPITDSYYDKELKKEVITDTVAYVRKIKGLKSWNDKKSIPLFFFLDTDFKTDFVQFYLDRDKKFMAFSFFESREKSFDDVIENLRTKYKQYEIPLKEDKQLSLVHAEKFQWETDNKIIAVMKSTKKIGDTYTFNLTVIKKPIDINIFPANRISNAPLCLDEACRD